MNPIHIQMDHYVLCEMRGLTVNQTADCLGILPSSARAAAARFGLKLAEASHSRNRKPITYQGVEYPSRTALAKAKGISSATVWHHLAKGHPERIGATDGKRIVGPRKASASPEAIARALAKLKVRG